MSAPAGWYPDPGQPGAVRWWDGSRWATATAPVWPASAPPVPRGPSAPGADTNTLWVYLMIAVTTLPTLGLFLVDWGSLGDLIAYSEGNASGGVIAFEATGWVMRIVLISLFSYVCIGVSILFAWLDWRELGRRGVARPFHWGYAFFALLVGIIVYIIGRTVVLTRETGSGMTALWVWIGATVATMVVSVWWSVWAMDQVMRVVF